MNLKLSVADLVTHWLNFLLIMTVFYFFFFETSTAPYWERFTLPKVIAYTAIGGILLWKKITCLRLKYIPVKISKKRFTEAFRIAGLERGWRHFEEEGNTMIAFEYAWWIRKGLRITAIWSENGILINSMPNPFIPVFPFSFGINTMNLKELEKRFEQAASGTDMTSLLNEKKYESLKIF